MIQEIENWLAEPAYWAGVELYDKYGDSDMLKKFFQGSSDSYNKKKLAAELTAILDKARELESAKPIIEDSAQVKDLKTLGNSLMDERAALKERARVLVASGIKEGPDLHEIAMSLAFGIRYQLDSIFGKIQFEKVNGVLPESDGAAVLTIADMIKRRNTLRTYLSRGGRPEKIEKWKAELFQLELKIKELES